MLELTEDEMYRAVERRDTRYDGRFYFCSRTCMIYCLPSCRARTPLRKNIVFFETRDEARAAGCRPCARCRPDGFVSDTAGKWFRAPRPSRINPREPSSRTIPWPPTERCPRRPAGGSRTRSGPWQSRRGSDA